MTISRAQIVGRLVMDADAKFYALAGIIEVPVGSIKAEAVHPFICVRNDSFGGIMPCANSETPVTSYDFGDSDVGSLVTEPIWRLPSNDFDGGSLYFRKTRMPPADGFEVLSFSGVMKFQGEFDTTALYELDQSDRIGLGFSDMPSLDVCGLRHPDEMERTNGEAFSSFLKKPIWGWVEDRVGFRSTMRLDVIDACEELSSLMNAGETSETSERVAKLDRGPAGDLVGSRSMRGRDIGFLAVSKRIAEIGAIRKWDSVLTRTDIETDEEIMAEAIRDTMDPDKGLVPHI